MDMSRELGKAPLKSKRKRNEVTAEEMGESKQAREVEDGGKEGPTVWAKRSMDEDGRTMHYCHFDNDALLAPYLQLQHPSCSPATCSDTLALCHISFAMHPSSFFAHVTSFMHAEPKISSADTLSPDKKEGPLALSTQLQYLSPSIAAAIGDVNPFLVPPPSLPSSPAPSSASRPQALQTVLWVGAHGAITPLHMVCRTHNITQCASLTQHADARTHTHRTCRTTSLCT